MQERTLKLRRSTAGMGEWVTLKAAAERLGVSEDAVRRSLKAGELVGREEPTVRGFRWVVELPGEDSQARSEEAPQPAYADAGVELTLLRTLVEELRADKEWFKRQLEEE